MEGSRDDFLRALARVPRSDGRAVVVAFRYPTAPFPGILLWTELLMPDNSFDVVSKIDMNEVLNAVQQTSKEIQTRYDLKDSKSTVELNEKDHKILLASSDEFKLKAVTEILGQKLVKRNVPLKGLEYGTITHAAAAA